MTKALIVVDIQNDYFPNGKMELVGSVEAAQVAAKIKEEYKALGLPVIMVQHIAKLPTATFFLPDTLGAEIHESLASTPPFVQPATSDSRSRRLQPPAQPRTWNSTDAL